MDDQAGINPATADGGLVELARLNRYFWAAALVPNRRVLDAGCGMGEGSAILARGGASEVVGVDTATAVLDAGRPLMPAGVSLRQGELTDLPFPDGTFDLVVCFDAFERAERPEVLLDELVRVVDERGVLATSARVGAPDRRRGWPAAELEKALHERFAQVIVLRQATWTATAIMNDEAFKAGDGEQLHAVTVHKLESRLLGSERHIVATATSGPAVLAHSSAVLGHPADAAAWTELWDARQRALTHAARRMEEFEHVRGERDELRRRLLEAEQALEPGYIKEFDELRDELAERELELERIHASVSWRLTAPLRLGTLVTRRLRRQ